MDVHWPDRSMNSHRCRVIEEARGMRGKLPHSLPFCNLRQRNQLVNRRPGVEIPGDAIEAHPGLSTIDGAQELISHLLNSVGKKTIGAAGDYPQLRLLNL